MLDTNDTLARCELTINDCFNAIDRYGMDVAVDVLFDTNGCGIVSYADFESMMRNVLIICHQGLTATN